MLGKIGRDSITGFTGVVMARNEYLTGCNQILLTPRGLTAEGKRQDGEWFDEVRIEIVDNTLIVLNKRAVEKNPGADERPGITQ